MADKEEQEATSRVDSTTDRASMADKEEQEAKSRVDSMAAEEQVWQTKKSKKQQAELTVRQSKYGKEEQ
jgi:hypothetical protein